MTIRKRTTRRTLGRHILKATSAIALSTTCCSSAGSVALDSAGVAVYDASRSDGGFTGVDSSGIAVHDANPSDGFGTVDVGSEDAAPDASCLGVCIVDAAAPDAGSSLDAEPARDGPFGIIIHPDSGEDAGG
jgi:hypothetical protein